MNYRKKPVVIKAFRINIDPIPDWAMDKIASKDIILHYIPFDEARATNYGQTWCEIKTLEGTMRGNPGDYIIQGLNGEIYPCKPDIFEKTYEPLKCAKCGEVIKTEIVFCNDAEQRICSQCWNSVQEV